MKNLREKGLDKETERKEDEEGADKDKRKYVPKKYTTNNKGNYQNKPRTYNNSYNAPNTYNGPKLEKDLDEDGFETIGTKPKKIYGNYKYNKGTDRKREDEEQKVWESVTERKEVEEAETEENRDHNVGENERPKREERPKEYRERKDKKRPYNKEQNVWNTEPEPVKEPIFVEEVVQPKKVEFIMVK